MSWALSLVFVVVAVASTAQTLSGFGYALIATPVVAVIVGPKEAVVGLTVSGIALAAVLAARGRGSVVPGAVVRFTLTALAGMPIGALVLDRANERILTAVIAVAVIGFALLLWWGLRLPARKATDAVAGFTAGVLSTSTGTSGPPIVIALSAKGFSPRAFRATISAIFLAQACAALLVFAVSREISTDALLVGLAGLPGVALGALIGERGFRRLDTAAFRRVVLVMLLLSGVVALIGAVLGT